MAPRVGFKLTILGCGTMGTAILSGILDSLNDMFGPHATKHPNEGTDYPAEFELCVSSDPSSKSLAEKYVGPQQIWDIRISHGRNTAAVASADMILLACKPYMVAKLLDGDMQDALKGKTMISICAGMSESDFSGLVPSTCRIVRAMPNTASKIRESMTVIAIPETPLPEKIAASITWMFESVGKVVRLPSRLMDASTALCGSGPAFAALVLEGMADGAVAMGIPRKEAQWMAAQTMRGAAGLVLDGEHPTLLRDKVSTPGGCTIGGLLVMEEGSVKGTVARAVREATVVASRAARGEGYVNAPR